MLNAKNAHVHQHTALFGAFACLAREYSRPDSQLREQTLFNTQVLFLLKVSII